MKKQKLSDQLICLVFFLLIGGFFILNIFSAPKDISVTERRKLAKMPEVSLKTVMNGQYATSFEKYALDQFTFRDKFRGLKSRTSYYIFNRQDNNNLFVLDDEIYRIEYPLRENSVIGAAKKFEQIYDMYLNDSNACYFSVIPDKSFFTAQQNGRLAIDYTHFANLLKDNIQRMTYIDLYSALNKEDYYATDTHWRQEQLQQVVSTLGEAMQFTPADFSQYQVNTLENFQGVYYGQVALDLPTESIVYLTNDLLNNAKVFNVETQQEMPVYTLEKYTEDLDPYNIFLSGPVTILEMENPQAKTEKELVIFRDSFGSSLAPMLLESYKTITLVDIRYIPARMVGEYVDFENKDVLFLYSTLILNNSVGLRI